MHLANKHDFARPATSNAAERAAVQTIGDALAGSNRPFLLASGVAALTPGRLVTEDDPSPFHGPESPRGGAENLAFEFADRGVPVVSFRFAPTVHGMGEHGFISVISGVARQRGVSGYPADATNRWAAVHRSDAARLIALGLAKAATESGGASIRLHAVAEDGIPSRRIAEAIGRVLDLPVASIDPGDLQGFGNRVGGFAGLTAHTRSGGSVSYRAMPVRGKGRNHQPERNIAMATIAAHEFITLDGVFEEPSWTFEYGFDPKMGETIDAITGQSSTILLGRRTFEMFAPAWRDRTAQDDPGAPFFNETQKFVVGARPLGEEWANTTALGAYDPAAIRRLKRERDGVIYISGSGQLVRALLSDGLVDELHFFVYPLALGKGERFWNEGDGPTRLVLKAHDVYDNGVVHHAYGPA